MKTPSEPVFHHYIPQFQLKLMTDVDGLLNVYDRKLNVFRKQSPVTSAGAKKLYTWKDKEGNEQTDVEKLNAQIEGTAAPIVQALHSGKKNYLSNQEKADLALLLALNWLRTPAARLRSELSLEAGATMYFRLNAQHKEYFYSRVEAFEKSTGQKIEDKEKFRQSFLDDSHRIKFDNVAYLQTLVNNLPVYSGHIQSLVWYIVIAKGDRSFILPDINFTIEPVEILDPNRGYGLLTPGTQSMCMLTNKLLVVMQPKPGNVIFKTPDPHFVRSTNYINAIRSQRFLFSNSEILLKSIVKKINLQKIPPPKIGVTVYSGPEDKTFNFTDDLK